MQTLEEFYYYWDYCGMDTNEGFYKRGWPQKKLHFLILIALSPISPLIKWLRRREK